MRTPYAALLRVRLPFAAFQVERCRMTHGRLPRRRQSIRWMTLSVVGADASMVWPWSCGGAASSNALLVFVLEFARGGPGSVQPHSDKSGLPPTFRCSPNLQSTKTPFAVIVADPPSGLTSFGGLPGASPLRLRTNARPDHGHDLRPARQRNSRTRHERMPLRGFQQLFGARCRSLPLALPANLGAL
jgi:hypothetical protein